MNMDKEKNIDSQGDELLFEQAVEQGDIWRACQTRLGAQMRRVRPTPPQNAGLVKTVRCLVRRTATTRASAKKAIEYLLRRPRPITAPIATNHPPDSVRMYRTTIQSATVQSNTSRTTGWNNPPPRSRPGAKK